MIDLIHDAGRSMKLIVVGRKKICGFARLEYALNEVHESNGITELLSGGITPGEKFAEKWASDRGIPFISLPPELVREGSRGFKIRIRRLIDMKPDAILTARNKYRPKMLIDMAR